MKKRKWLIFLITVFATSIVVFNNFTDLLNKLFKPEFNQLFFVGLGLITIGSIWYVTINWSEKNA